jgi:hypothetical protein
MARLGERLGVAMAALLPKVTLRWTAGAVLILTEMVGLTRQLTGWLALVVWEMHGQQILLNGMTETVMAEETILEVQRQTFVLTYRELPLVLLLVETAGVAMTQMAMVGQI